MPRPFASDLFSRPLFCRSVDRIATPPRARVRYFLLDLLVLPRVKPPAEALVVHNLRVDEKVAFEHFLDTVDTVADGAAAAPVRAGQGDRSVALFGDARRCAVGALSAAVQVLQTAA